MCVFTNVIKIIKKNVYCRKNSVMDKDKIGQKGEQIAKEFLIEQGYYILVSNWRFQHKEIDIIAQKNDLLVIVEVKTRSSNYIKPREAVNKKKQQNLIMATAAYIEQYQIDLNVRFDVIEIILTNKMYKIHHIKEAFYPTL